MNAGQAAYSHTGYTEDCVQRAWRRNNAAVFGFSGVFLVAVEFIIKIADAVAPVRDYSLTHRVIMGAEIFSLKIGTDSCF